MDEKESSNVRRRQQKVYYKHHDYKGGYFHPHIRIAGKYLKEFDFNVGDSIEVYVTKGKITILKIPEKNSPP